MSQLLYTGAFEAYVSRDVSQISRGRKQYTANTPATPRSARISNPQTPRSECRKPTSASTPATTRTITRTLGSRRGSLNTKTNAAGGSGSILVYPTNTTKSDNYCSFCSFARFGVTGVNIGEYLSKRDKPIGPAIPVDLFNQMDMSDTITITFKWPGYKPIAREVEVQFVHDRGLLFHALVMLVQELIGEAYNNRNVTLGENWKIGPGGISFDRIWIKGFDKTQQGWIPWLELAL